MKDRLLVTGVVGTLVAAVCCFTPLLAVLLSAVGVSAVIGWLDWVLIPALAVFVVILLVALARRHR